jgi:tetratricopeptide (TPR) repeat protein
MAAAASLRIARGDFGEGERLANEACALGERAGDLDATTGLLKQFYTLCWMRGCLEDVVDAVAAYADENPLSIVAHVAQTHALAHCGRFEEASACLDQLSAKGFDQLPVNINWYANAGLLAETAALLGDERRAAALVPLLAPHRALTIDVGGSSTFMGPMARYLGQVLATTGRLDEAVEALNEAIERAEASGTVPWATLARHDLAGVLRRRAAGTDLAVAGALEAVAIAEAARLGMGDLARRCGNATQSS